jgi:gas vesicle protein
MFELSEDESEQYQAQTTGRDDGAAARFQEGHTTQMANQQGTGPGGVLLAFIAGAAVGAAVALLYAPASGEDAREFVSQRAREGRERAAEAARQGRDLINRQRENVTTAFERAREQALAATRDAGSEREQDA